MDVFGIGGRVRGTIISSGKESNIGFVDEASSCTIERAALSVDVCSGMSSAFAVSMLRDELSTVATPARSGVEQWRFRYGGWICPGCVEFRGAVVVWNPARHKEIQCSTNPRKPLQQR